MVTGCRWKHGLTQVVNHDCSSRFCAGNKHHHPHGPARVQHRNRGIDQRVRANVRRTGTSARAASPDGTRIYAVGEFTKVNGVNHRAVALNPSDGSPVSTFTLVQCSSPPIVATADAVYIGKASPMSAVSLVRASLLSDRRTERCSTGR